MSELAAQTTTVVGDRADAAEKLDFAQLVRDNQAMVYSIAFHSLHESAVAEEVAQDVFLQLHRSLGRIRSSEHATHWLRKVASHRVIDYARRHGNRVEVDLDNAPELAVAERVNDPMLSLRLRKLVASLPEKKRLLIVLRYQEELELEEIASVMDIPVRTVRTQMFRTLALLREKASRFLGERPMGGTRQ